MFKSILLLTLATVTSAVEVPFWKIENELKE